MRITLIAVQSLDGFITRHETPGSAFASPADQAHLRNTLAGFDCCVMGGTTYRLERARRPDRPLPARLQIVLTRSPDTFVAETVPGRLEFTAASVPDLVIALRARGIKNCALLGGSQIHSLFLNARLVDELWLTIEPRLFGNGTPLIAHRDDIPLKLLAQQALTADTLLLKYAVSP